MRSFNVLFTILFTPVAGVSPWSVSLILTCKQYLLWEISIAKYKDARRPLCCILFLHLHTSSLFFFFYGRHFVYTSPALPLLPTVTMKGGHCGSRASDELWRCIEFAWHHIISDLDPAPCPRPWMNLPNPQLFPSITPSVTPLSAPSPSSSSSSSSSTSSSAC